MSVDSRTSIVPYSAYPLQRVSWRMAQMGELTKQHLESLAEYPPVQGGKSFDMSNGVEEFVDKAVQ